MPAMSIRSWSLCFGRRRFSGRVELVHVNVADQDVQEGWEKYYWTPWLKYLQRIRYQQ
jgi:hypothetical protein